MCATHAYFLKLEDDVAAARDCSHQLRQDEAAAHRLLQQRDDDLQRTCRFALQRVSQHRYLMMCRRLAEAEDRLSSSAAAAAANETSRVRQAQAVQTLELEAAEARARVRELELFAQQQTSLLQTRAQSESQYEEAIRHLQQVRTCKRLFPQFFDRPAQRLHDSEARASDASRAASESAGSLHVETENREKLEAALTIKDRQLSSLMALNAR